MKKVLSLLLVLSLATSLFAGAQDPRYIQKSIEEVGRDIKKAALWSALAFGFGKLESNFHDLEKSFYALALLGVKDDKDIVFKYEKIGDSFDYAVAVDAYKAAGISKILRTVSKVVILFSYVQIVGHTVSAVYKVFRKNAAQRKIAKKV